MASENIKLDEFIDKEVNYVFKRTNRKIMGQDNRISKFDPRFNEILMPYSAGYSVINK